MTKVRKKPTIIELFRETNGEVIRIIRFKNPKKFDDFLNDFAAMRYPGYKWRLKEITKRRVNK